LFQLAYESDIKNRQQPLLRPDVDNISGIASAWQRRMIRTKLTCGALSKPSYGCNLRAATNIIARV
jgi:hypothetical protein